MKIICASIGSRGDIQPILALALELKRLGHDITMCTPPDFEDWIKSFGLHFHPMGLSIKNIIKKNPDFFQKEKKPNKKFFSIMLKQLEAQFTELYEISKGKDLIIGTGPLHGAASVAEALKIKYQYVLVSPNALPSAEYSPQMTNPKQNLPRFINSLYWKIGNLLSNKIMLAPINQNRKKFGLPPLSNFIDYMYGHGSLIIACDKEIAPVAHDVKQNYAQIPSLILPSQEKNLDKRIESFLSAGKPPVYIGFGSMPVKDPIKTTNMIIDISKKLKKRFIISKGWADLGQVKIPDSILLIDLVPHDLLFPYMSMVIHHGGSGTVAVSARAGIPQIIIPVEFDQFYFGKRVYLSKLGPQPCPIFNITEKYLSEAINECSTNTTIIEKATTVGDYLRTKKGSQEAAKIIDRVVR